MTKASRSTLGRMLEGSALVGAAAAGAWAAAPRDSEAHHILYPDLHITGMHDDSEGLSWPALEATYEYFCSDKTNVPNESTTYISHTMINPVLTAENPGSDWHNPDNAPVYKRLFLRSSAFASQTDCDLMTPLERGSTDIEIHVAYNNSGSATPCPDMLDNLSCVTHQGPVTHQGHTDHFWSNIYFDWDNINPDTPDRRHAINHEMGHVLGLADPPPCLDGGGVLIQSVMHSDYYCSAYGATDLEWPTSNDRLAVIGIMNQK